MCLRWSILMSCEINQPLLFHDKVDVEVDVLVVSHVFVLV